MEPSSNQHRPSLTGTSTASSAPRRNSLSKNHAHSVSLGTFNPDHRVTRRKSVNAGAVSNFGALRAALNVETEGHPRSSSHRRSLPSKSNRHSQGYSSGPDGPKNGTHLYGEALASNDESAVADDLAPSQPSGSSTKARARRASEGSHLGNGKRASGELRCEKCGKGYKHSSCLTKHLSVFPDLPFLQSLAFIMVAPLTTSHPASLEEHSIHASIAKCSLINVIGGNTLRSGP